MSNIQSFNNPAFGEIRTLTIEDEPWFVGKDVAEVLGYSNTRDALDRHVDEEDKNTVANPDGNRGNPNMTIINESGLYSLVLSSKLPTAKQFKRWVTSDVLPSIRKHGAYMTEETLEAAILNPDTMITICRQLKIEQDKRKELESKNALLLQDNAELKHKSDYVDLILESVGAVTTGQIAADYGMSAKRLNNILHKSGVQYKINGQWVLYSSYRGAGYTKSHTIQITHSDGRPDTVMETRWTQKGRLMINEILNRGGIYANIDISA